MWPVLTSVLIILLILIIWAIFIPGKGPSEHMTRIHRGVGVLNDADEIPVAAGIVASTPLMDYTYTYWDGERNVSCDECPNETVCAGSCPHMTITRNSTEHFDLAVGTHDDASRVIDLPQEYTSSREHSGAVSTKHTSMTAGRAINRLPSEPTRGFGECTTDDVFGCRLMKVGRVMNMRDTVDFLYGEDHSVSTTDNNITHPPAPDDCTFYNKAGVSYKEPCKYSSPIVNTLAFV